MNAQLLQQKRLAGRLRDTAVQTKAMDALGRHLQAPSNTADSGLTFTRTRLIPWFMALMEVNAQQVRMADEAGFLGAGNHSEAALSRPAKSAGT